MLYGHRGPVQGPTHSDPQGSQSLVKRAHDIYSSRVGAAVLSVDGVRASCSETLYLHCCFPCAHYYFCVISLARSSFQLFVREKVDEGWRDTSPCNLAAQFCAGFPRYLSSVMQDTFRSLGQQYRGDVRYVLGISLHLQTGSRSFSTYIVTLLEDCCDSLPVGHHGSGVRLGHRLSVNVGMKPHSLRDWGHLHARLRHRGVILEKTQQR